MAFKDSQLDIACRSRTEYCSFSTISSVEICVTRYGFASSGEIGSSSVANHYNEPNRPPKKANGVNEARWYGRPECRVTQTSS